MINSVTKVAAGSTGINTETVIATLPNISLGAGAPNGVLIRGFIAGTYAGTGGSQITYKCRQGSLAGPQVDNSITTFGSAGGTTVGAVSFNDTTTVPEQLGGITYVITAQTNGSTAGAVAGGEITVEV
jgi:hypothetical protein